jgi:hypothetical protein
MILNGDGPTANCIASHRIVLQAQFDTDHDGKITRAEFARALHADGIGDTMVWLLDKLSETVRACSGVCLKPA